MPQQTRRDESLPIAAHRREIIDGLRNNAVLIVAGETGSGKSTQIPQICLGAGVAGKRLIGCTQPRRIAAMALARRVGQELGAARDGAGATGLVGYKIRFQDNTGPRTRIKFMTDGVLLAEAQTDRWLRRYGVIIVDEAHERSLNIDFLLGMLRRILEKRNDLKVIITSATIDTEKFSRAFVNAPVIEVKGRTYPVEIRYEPAGRSCAIPDARDTPPIRSVGRSSAIPGGRDTSSIRSVEEESDDDGGYVEACLRTLERLCREAPPGDILAFLPTERDIRETAEGLTARLRHGDCHGGGTEVLPLFGRLSTGDQSRIFAPLNKRKVVIATNIAETSLTVPGIRYVVDTGLARLSLYSPRARTTKMPVLPVSRASCDQRMGRCGRIGPGLCIRLFSEESYEGRPLYTAPEILRTNLAEVILRMLALGLGAPASFPFIDPPSRRALHDGYQLLHELGALAGDDRPDGGSVAGARDGARATDRLDGGSVAGAKEGARATGREPKKGKKRPEALSPAGELMARLPLDPRLAKMIIEARDRNALREVIIIAAALSIQDPRLRPTDAVAKADAAHGVFVDPQSDFMTFINIFNMFNNVTTKAGKSRARKFCEQHFLSYQRMREWLDIHEQISQIIRDEPGFHFRPNAEPAPSEAIHQALLSGNLRHIAMKREKNAYLGCEAKDIFLFPGSGLFNRGGAWIMAAELVETTKLYGRIAANIKVEWIEPLARGLCRYSYSHPHWEKRQGQVVASEKVTLGGLVIVAGRRVNYGKVRSEEARAIFIAQGLVPGELGKRYAFLAQNLALIKSLQEMEDRVRRRDVMVDEFQLIRFYEDRLGAGVCDQASLDRFLKTRDGDGFLVMREEDLLLAEPETAILEQFPATLEMGGATFTLHYRFDPGADDDGVTMLVPLPLLSLVEQQACDWLVPGLLGEKVLFLLKGLPKESRRHLVPIPAAATMLTAALAFGQGSLHGALEKSISDQWGIKVARNAWPRELPPHLLMRFSLIDQDRPLEQGRDLQQLSARAQSEPETLLVEQARRRWEREGIGDWDFAELPERVPLVDRAGSLHGFLYPCLAEDDKGGVAIRLLASEEEKKQQNRTGLLALYRCHFREQWKMVKKDLVLAKNQWPLLQWLGNRDEVIAGIFFAMLIEVFAAGTGIIPEKEAFQAKIVEVREKGLYNMMQQRWEELMHLLAVRQILVADLDGYEAKAGVLKARLAAARTHLAAILPPDFLEFFAWPRLAPALRYMQALRIRLERMRVDPGKDAQKELLIAPHANRLTGCRRNDRPSCPEKERLLAEYAEMIEEYRISLFAQELKTAFPVSPLRLEKKWRELEPLC